MKPLLRLMTELTSRKTLSKLVGAYAKSRWSRILIARFAKSYGIPLHEAEREIQEYASLNAFFTRRLKPGMRPIDPADHSLISPVDAVITGIGRIRAGQIIQVKGQDYTISELLNENPRTVNYDEGFFVVLYLSPRDYHRIHAPVGGTIVEKEHIPGKVYPVNDFGLRHMKRVLARNERLVTYIRHDCGEVAVVKVGALNVSSIQYVDPLPSTLAKGDELAYFEFGSTVVLLMENDTFEPGDRWKEGSRIRMGESLGLLHSKHKEG